MSTPLDDDKLKSKLKKLYALAERGEGGEKDNAQRMLDKLLAMHNLVLTDLLSEERDRRTFICSNSWERRLAIQIIAMIKNTPTIDYFYKQGNGKQFSVDLTAEEAIEFELRYSVLRVALKEHLQIAYRAFINANEIFPADCVVASMDEVDERMLKAARMAATIEPTPIHRQVTDQSVRAKG